MLRRARWDVVVVGAGTAGMPCAIAASQAGASVLVLEKSSEPGGTLHMSVGQMSGAGTRRQAAKGIDDSPDAHFAEVMRIGHGKNDPDLVRRAVDEAGATLDWLDDLGFPYPENMPVIYHGHEPYSKPRTVWGREMGVSILKTVEPLFRSLVASGQIELLTDHTLTELMVRKGRVEGVRALNDGHVTDFRGQATVLATGGYGASAELFDRFHPGVHCLLGARATSTGDGLRAATAIGAATRGADCHLSTAGAIETEPGSGRWEFWDALANLAPYYRPPREIWVNATGERFVAEDNESADVRERAVEQTDGRFWIAFDETAISDESPLVLGWSNEMLREEAQLGTRVWRADDLAELGRRAGIDSRGLVGAVADFNAAVAAGVDPLGRTQLDLPLTTPPYYAVAAHAGTTVSFAGLTVDGGLRVIDQDGTLVEGLYAAGEVLGAAALMGDAFSGGMCVTPALTLGRWLGRRLGSRAVA